jgi:hypothetical protein
VLPIHPTLSLIGLIWLAALAFQVFALADAIIRPSRAYVAAGKLTKPAWVAILAVSLIAVQVIGVLGIFGLAAAVATIVYFVDVRPALRAIGGGRGRRSTPW